MKNMKRLLSVLLCLAMVLAVLPMAVSAAGTTIYVQPNSNWLTDGAWFAAYFYGNGETWIACTDAGDGLYSVEAPAGYPNVIFCRMNPADTTTLDWSNKWNQTADLTVPTDDKVVYVVDGWDKGAGQWIVKGGEVEEVEVVYYLRGDMNSWDTSAPMTNNGDGTWSITMSLAAGTYQYKAADAGWGTAVPSGDNASVTIDADCDVTFVLDTNAGTVTATAESVVEPDPVVYDYYVAGSDTLCGENWDPAADKMTLGEDGLYTITFENIAAGTHEYKITVGNWDTSYGPADAENYSVSTEAYLSNVTITFNAETKEANASVEVAVAEEPGVADIKWQVSADFTAESASTDLRLVTWVDSLDYASVTFTVTAGGVTKDLVCDKVYTAINAAGVSLTAADIFGEEAAYLATYTIEGITADAYSDIEVTITWTDLDGNETVSETRTFSIA